MGRICVRAEPIRLISPKKLKAWAPLSQLSSQAALSPKSSPLSLSLSSKEGCRPHSPSSSQAAAAAPHGHQISPAAQPSPAQSLPQTVKITKTTVKIVEEGMKLILTIVDTPGFGDALNNSYCWKPIAEYVDQQFEQYFRDESGLNRKNILDNRVHCCLYFISPFGHGLRPLDVEFMKALHQRVSIVPILAKADALTAVEVAIRKCRIRDELEHYGIQIYQFALSESDDEEELRKQDLELKMCFPFAVIASNTVVEKEGKRVLGRIYPWGVVEVEDPSISDLMILRLELKAHMQRLKDVTQETYENYRMQCLQNMTLMVVKDRHGNYVPEMAT